VVSAESREQGLWILLDQEHPQMFRLDEPLVDGVIQESHQRVEIVADVEQAARLLVEAKLGPGEDLEQFLDGA
jgi:hypothetical protein